MTREDRPLDEKGWLAQQALAARAVDEYRAKLRAKVEAMQDAANQLSSDAYDQGIRAALRQVIDLIDGSK